MRPSRDAGGRVGERVAIRKIAQRIHYLVSSTLACAAMPSSRPTKPSFSVVVAFTLTASSETPIASAVAARMASRCGAIFGSLGEDRDVGVGDAVAAIVGELHGVLEEVDRRGAFPLRVGGREVVADVAEREGAEDGVGEGVPGGVGVGMALQLLRVRDADAAEDDGVARLEAVDVEARADAQGRGGDQFLGHGEVLRIGDLHKRLPARRQHDLRAGGFDEGEIVHGGVRRSVRRRR